jgi:hypothetical protein
MGRLFGFALAVAVALLAAGCGSDASYSKKSEQQFVSGCSKAAANSVAANLGTSEWTAAQTTALKTYCTAALTCIEQALSPSQFAKASVALHDRKPMAASASTALGVCTHTAAISTGLSQAFAHTYPAAARTAFLTSCRATAMRGVSRLHHHRRLSTAQAKAVETYCGGSLACVVKSVTVDQFVAYDRALHAGQKGDKAVRGLINGCAAAQLPALRAAFRKSRA